MSKIINWYGAIGQGEGYSGASEGIMVALQELGWDIRLVGVKKAITENITKEGLEILRKPFELSDVGIFFGYPNGFNSVVNKVKIGYTMFETDRLPNGINNNENSWAGLTGNSADIINQMNELWVPCEQNKNLFINEGVTIPIAKIPLGINPHIYKDFSDHRDATRKDRPFTFLMLGALTSRKNPGAAAMAFLSLFMGKKDVKLILKTHSGTLAHMQFHQNSNIEIVDERVSKERLQQYYAEADAFIFPSRGEGFGLPPLEAMSTGLPTIFSNNTGMSEFVNSEYNYPIECPTKTKVVRFPKKWGDCGNSYEPDFEQLKAQMFYVYKNQEEARLKGRAAAKWVAENWTYENTAKKIIKQIEKYI